MILSDYPIIPKDEVSGFKASCASFTSLWRLVSLVEFMSDREPKFACGWDGDSASWPDFVRKARLAFERTPRKRRHLLAPDIIAQLSGRAWIVTQEIDHSQVVRRDGIIYLLRFLETRLGPGVVHDVGTRMENLILRLRRPPGELLHLGFEIAGGISTVAACARESSQDRWFKRNRDFPYLTELAYFA